MSENVKKFETEEQILNRRNRQRQAAQRHRDRTQTKINYLENSYIELKDQFLNVEFERDFYRHGLMKIARNCNFTFRQTWCDIRYFGVHIYRSPKI